MVTILLTGTYNSRNKGDAAMELSAIALLSEYLGDAEVVVSSPFPEIDRTLYAPTPVVACSRRRLIVASLALLGALAWRLLKKLAGWDCRWLLFTADLKATRACDLVIDLSGDMQTEASGVHVAYSHFLPLLRALVLGKPYMLCAQSIGPFRFTRPLARFLLKHAAAITVREDISAAYIASLDLRHDRVERTNDLAFFLQAAPPARALAILKDEGVPHESPLLIGISVSQLVASRYQQLNPLARRTTFVELIANLIDELAEEYGATVLLVPHVTGPAQSKDDRIVGQRVLDHVQHRNAVYTLSGDYQPAELKAIISRCALFCGARMHANIAALSSGVPTVAIAYSHKTRGIMRDCDQSTFVFDIETLRPDELYAGLCRALDERATIAAQLAERLPALRHGAETNAKIARQLLSLKEGQSHERSFRHNGKPGQEVLKT